MSAPPGIMTVCKGTPLAEPTVLHISEDSTVAVTHAFLRRKVLGRLYNVEMAPRRLVRHGDEL